MEGLSMMPKNDKTAIYLILSGLKSKGYTLVSVVQDTWNPDEVALASTAEEATNLMCEVDEGFVRIDLPGTPLDLTGKTSDAYIYFVLGNSPEEVACDYTTNLDPDLSSITDPWTT